MDQKIPSFEYQRKHHKVFLPSGNKTPACNSNGCEHTNLGFLNREGVLGEKKLNTKG